ncbi:MAG: HNH endonuclease [Bacteroidetes bacterium SB0662_bin_6]|nr:HNH endonuclease [Gammaproteobacteria bacterium]MYE04855.1 HNH endonuclease [Bacteroidetes bacterium SB0662_bin_6]
MYKEKIVFVLASLNLMLPLSAQDTNESWRELTVMDEYRCSPYVKDDYDHPQSVEPRIIASMGGRIYGPYSGRTFGSRFETDIEHIVGKAEAHDSGLCGADKATRKEFAKDLLNLTLAAPACNRCNNIGGKCALDAAEWLPPRNQCWFVARIIEVRLKYGLTIDEDEAEAIDSVLENCDSTEMIFYEDAVPCPAN